MTNQQTAAEQVAEALEQLTDAAIAATHGVIDQHIVAAIQNAHAALKRWRAEQDSDGWLPIETAPTDRNVHVHYLNSHGKHRVIKACKVERYTVEADDDDCAEYDEANDRYTLLPGWWEQIDNWGDYSQVLVSEGEPDFWRELPPHPKAASQGGEA